MIISQPTRVWVNQPSTLQGFHDLHGKRGVAISEPGDTDIVTIYFTEGPIISQRIPKRVLSPCGE